MCPATFLDNNNRRSKVFFILFSRHLESDRAQERNHLCRAADCFVFLSEKKKKTSSSSERQMNDDPDRMER